MSQLVLKHPDLKHEDLKFNTVEVHAGEPRDMYGALIPPIYQTSTFYFDSTDDAVKACDDYAESFAYSRITNPSVDYLEQKLAALEHGNRTILMQGGQIKMDISGKERDEMTVEKLIEKFEIDNDRMLL